MMIPVAAVARKLEYLEAHTVLLHTTGTHSFQMESSKLVGYSSKTRQLSSMQVSTTGPGLRQAAQRAVYLKVSKTLCHQPS